MAEPSHHSSASQVGKKKTLGTTNDELDDSESLVGECAKDGGSAHRAAVNKDIATFDASHSAVDTYERVSGATELLHIKLYPGCYK